MSPSGEAAVGSSEPRQKGRATADTLLVGCIAMVQKDGQPRRAEILSIKETKSGRQFYCNFDNFNKRLDEWVPAARIDFSSDVEWPNPDKDKPKDGKVGKKGATAAPSKKNQPPRRGQKRPLALQPGRREASVASETTGGTPQHPWSEFVESQSQSQSQQKTPVTATPAADDGEDRTASAASASASAAALAAGLQDVAATPGAASDDMDIDDDKAAGAGAGSGGGGGGASAADQQAAAATPGSAGRKKKERAPSFSREEEIEKLRTSGSMTQNPTEVSRIRNISQIQFGKFDLYPWYFSPYPEPFSLEDVVYICEFCLSYYGDQKSFTRHRRKCTLQHPPGNEIYRDANVSFFEIDGRRQRTWCRNLCLLSKMFLDHKTLYYDVDPFLFYVMTTKDDKGDHLVGYFSKEKESLDGYNVACILTLPQYQRQGFGRLLIHFSYELSRIEGKLGSPEKPLSDLGLLSYRQYWSENIVDLLVGYHERDEKCTIESIATQLAMTTADVEHTLQALKMQVYHKGEHKVVIPEKLLAQREKAKSKQRRAIEPSRIQWKPPVFTASSRTWGW